MDVANTTLVNHVKYCVFQFCLFNLSRIRYNKLVSELGCIFLARKMDNLKVDKFTGRNSFSLWQIKTRALLNQQGLWAPLKTKITGPVTAEMAILEEKAHSTILLALADDIITEIAEEETAFGLWSKLESLYMTKSLTNK